MQTTLSICMKAEMRYSQIPCSADVNSIMNHLLGTEESLLECSVSNHFCLKCVMLNMESAMSFMAKVYNSSNNV